MVLRGVVKNGVVVFEKDVGIPEGTQVRIELLETGSEKARTLAERFADVIGAATDLPEDLAAQHDHYIHGTPKQ